MTGRLRRLTEEALPHLRGVDETKWLDRLESEHDNIRQALRWSIDAGQVDLAQRLAGILYRFWMIRLRGRGSQLARPGARAR